METATLWGFSCKWHFYGPSWPHNKDSQHLQMKENEKYNSTVSQKISIKSIQTSCISKVVVKLSFILEYTVQLHIFGDCWCLHFWDMLYFVLKQFPFVTVLYCQELSFFSTKQYDVYLSQLDIKHLYPIFHFQLHKAILIAWSSILFWMSPMYYTWLLHRYFTYYVQTVNMAWRVLRLRIEEQPPIRRVAANKVNKQSRTVDEGWSSSFGVGRGANNPSL